MIERPQWLRPDAVDPSLGVDPHVHQARVTEHSQVLGDSRLTEFGRADQIAHRSFGFDQQVEDLAAVGLGENCERTVIASPPEYTKSGI